MSQLPALAGDYLPHAAPMLCIDTLISASATSAEADVLLSAGHILLHKGRMQEAGYVELAAQTAGAMKGFADKVLGLPAREGFLAAIQDFSVYGLATQGERLRITVSLQAEVSGISLIKAEIFRSSITGSAEQEGTLLASGKLKVFVPQSTDDGEEVA